MKIYSSTIQFVILEKYNNAWGEKHLFFMFLFNVNNTEAFWLLNPFTVTHKQKFYQNDG